MSSVKFEDTEYEYDGEEKTIEISGDLPDGVSVEYTIEACEESNLNDGKAVEVGNI